jgi:hypothetical protein
LSLFIGIYAASLMTSRTPFQVQGGLFNDALTVTKDLIQGIAPEEEQHIDDAGNDRFVTIVISASIPGHQIPDTCRVPYLAPMLITVADC